MANDYSGGAQAPSRPRKPRRGPAQGIAEGLRDRPANIRPPKPKRPRQPKLAFGNKQKVKGGVKQRATRRLKAVGGVKGVDTKDGLTGREARKVKRAWIREGRPTPGGKNRGNAGRGNAGQGKATPFDPLAPLTGRGLRREVNTLANLEYGPQLRQLQSERRISNQQQVNVGGWYQNYLNEVKQAAAQQQAFAQGFQQAAYQQANQAATADQGQNQQLLQQQQTQAAQRGTTVDPSVAQNMQAGVAARQAQGTAAGGLIAAQGQAQTGYLQNRVGVAAGQGVQAQQDELRKRQQIEQLSRDLRKEMGQFKVKARGQLRDTERTYALNRAAFGLDVAEEQNRAAEAARDDRREAQKARADRRDKRADNRRQAARDRLLNASTRADIKKKKGEVALDRNADLADDGRRNFSTDYSEWAQRTRPSKDEDGKSGNGSDSFTPTQRRNNRTALENGQGIANKNRDKGYRWLLDNMQDAGYDRLMAQVIARRATGKPIPGSLLGRFTDRYGFTPKSKKRGPKAFGGPGTGLPRGTVG